VGWFGFWGWGLVVWVFGWGGVVALPFLREGGP